MTFQTPSSAITDELADVAVSAARLAGPELLRWWGRPRQVDEKSAPGDLVTEVDREAERIIREQILRRWPDSTIVGEEGGRHGTGAVEWYVDPIDGTANFVHGIPFFCTSIAATVDGECVAAAILDPVRDELFATGPAGTTLNGAPVTVQAATGADAVTLLTAFPYEGKVASTEQLAPFGRLVEEVGSLRRLGSIALELAYVAAGRAHVAFELRTRPWDVAAGLHLVERAGGSYRTSPDAVSAPARDKHLSRSFVACRPGYELTPALLTHLRSIFAGREDQR